jgi:hypothetical protein
MKVLQLADVKEQMFALGAELGGDSPRDFNAFVNASVHTLGRHHQRKRHPPPVELGAEHLRDQ